MNMVDWLPLQSRCWSTSPPFPHCKPTYLTPATGDSAADVGSAFCKVTEENNWKYENKRKSITVFLKMLVVGTQFSLQTPASCPFFSPCLALSTAVTSYLILAAMPRPFPYTYSAAPSGPPPWNCCGFRVNLIGTID